MRDIGGSTANSIEGADVSSSASSVATTNFRWVICGLLLFGATINYMDRQILGVFKTTLQHDLGWNEIDYSNVVAFFQGAYAIGMLGMGWLIDRLGTRRGYSLAMIFWSVASIRPRGRICRSAVQSPRHIAAGSMAPGHRNRRARHRP